MYDVQVSHLPRSQARAAADLHLRCFDDGFLESLGIGVLTVFYSQVCQDPSCATLVAEDGSGIVGLAVGTTNQHGMYKRLLTRHGMRFALAAVPAAVRSPQTVVGLVHTLRRPAESRDAACPALLMFLCVRSELRRRGIGRRLLLAYLAEMSGKQVDRVSLTAAVGNEPAIHLYESVGFQPLGFVAKGDGRQMREYMLVFGQRAVQVGGAVQVATRV